MTHEKPEVMPHGLYTGREAARLIGVDRHTVTRWKRSGKLAPATDDGRYRGRDIVAAWQGRNNT